MAAAAAVHQLLIVAAKLQLPIAVVKLLQFQIVVAETSFRYAAIWSIAAIDLIESKKSPGIQGNTELSSDGSVFFARGKAFQEH